jgi:hypothetical protein
MTETWDPNSYDPLDGDSYPAPNNGLMNRIKNFLKLKRLKPLEWSGGRPYKVGSKCFCPNCDRQLEDSEIKCLKRCYGGGDVRWTVKSRCKVCGKKDSYNQSW